MVFAIIDAGLADLDRLFSVNPMSAGPSVLLTMPRKIDKPIKHRNNQGALPRTGSDRHKERFGTAVEEGILAGSAERDISKAKGYPNVSRGSDTERDLELQPYLKRNHAWTAVAAQTYS
jgi:hypothetical protein